MIELDVSEEYSISELNMIFDSNPDLDPLGIIESFQNTENSKVPNATPESILHYQF